MSQKRAILLILAISFLTHFNTLFNNFTGDTKALFVGNTFYKSLSNLPVLLRKDFVTTPEIFSGAPSPEPASFSGCVSYRPVTSLTFFADYFFWKDRPAGHHLTNIVLHCVVALLVYFFIIGILTKNPRVSLMAALLFAVHPIQSEVVSNIGYRSDLLAALFYLAALLSYIRYRAVFRGGGRRWFLLSCLFFAFGLFSKETVMTFPLIAIAYDACFLKRTRAKEFIKTRIPAFWGYVSILAFYCAIYFGVMKNEFYPRFLLADGGYLSQLQASARILWHYLAVIILPFKITVLPPLYTFPAGLGDTGGTLALASVVALLCLSIWAGYKSWASDKIVLFGLVWFWVTSLPTSNLIPLLNPIAFRFLYLPSVGVFTLLALGLDRLLQKTHSRKATVLVPAVLIGLCMSLTISNNTFFKNTIVVSKEIIRNYPDSSRPYWALGVEYYEKGRYEKAAANFQKYLTNDPRNPYALNPRRNFAVYYFLGQCHRSDPNTAIAYFKKVIQLKPDYVLAYIDLSKMYLMKGEGQRALAYAQHALALKNDWPPGYVLAVHSHLVLGQNEQARALLLQALAQFPDDQDLRHLQTRLKKK